jgi:hypothetical protein
MPQLALQTTAPRASRSISSRSSTTPPVPSWPRTTSTRRQGVRRRPSLVSREVECLA